jgi:hypothetical protein
MALAVLSAAARDVAGLEWSIARIRELLPGAPLEAVFAALRAGARRPGEP